MMMNSSQIRQAFITYFQQKGHMSVESSSLVPGDDPSLLFTNAGMVQFKKVFLGMEARGYSRAVTAQRCVRAGGKHNDLDNVGHTARHHTFFEMLGNFSFGDYFKRDAIYYAWEFLTQVLHLPAERLWVTVYKDDDEAAEIWLKDVGVSSARFSRCGDEDNFWSMGDTGPCGPCTEIFYDHGPEIAGGPPGSPEADGDRYIEIWNLVFMQYNRDKAGVLHPLPKPSVDTGMGLERISAVVQGVHTNYEIDSFQRLIASIAALNPSLDRKQPSVNVIADHIRACAFLIADGVIPGNEGRGYVLRRIMRRAIRHGHQLNLPSPFFSKLVSPLIDIMGDAYPQLSASHALIEHVLDQEEQRFEQTLDQGLRLLHGQLTGLKGKTVPGTIAFKLYDTYGFPLDLTQDIARDLKLEVDIAGFEAAMQQQRQLSQSQCQFTGDYSSLTIEIKEPSLFQGYELEKSQATIVALLVNGQNVNQVNQGETAIIVLDKTPFYAESGGQVGDRGLLTSTGGLFEVEDTHQAGNAIAHCGKITSGRLHLGDKINAEINGLWRASIRLNHTATHLLHAALKKVVGPHVQQKGSLVHAERARFDFSHSEALTSAQVAEVERLVNEQVRHNYPVETELMSLDAAKESGAVALFGEKYGDSVRVLSIGDFSKELCGGTHAARTGDIGLFKITAEYGVATGIRRIELLTGFHALTWVNQQLACLETVASALKTSSSMVYEKLQSLLQETKEREKVLADLSEQLALKSSVDLLGEVKTMKGIGLLIKKIDNSDLKSLRLLLDKLNTSIDKAVIVLFTVQDKKIQVIASVNRSLTGHFPSAIDLVKTICGKGGGRPDMAQGGGDLPLDLDQRITKVEALVYNSEVM